MDTPTPPAPEKRKRKRVWKVLGWAVVLFLVIGCIIYVLGVELYRRVISSVELYYNVAFAAQMYANDLDGRYPPLSTEPGRLMYAPEVLINHDIVSDVMPWSYPGEPGRNDIYLPELSKLEAAEAIYEHVNDQSYYYLGYAVSNEVEGRAFIRAYKDTIARGGNFEDDLFVPTGQGNFGGDRLLRLRDDMIEYLGKTRQMSESEVRRWESGVVFLMSNPRKRQRSFFPPKDYSNGIVCFLDTHVDVRKVPGEFPYTEEFLSALEELDRMSDNGPPERPAR